MQIFCRLRPWQTWRLSIIFASCMGYNCESHYNFWFVNCLVNVFALVYLIIALFTILIIRDVICYINYMKRLELVMSRKSVVRYSSDEYWTRFRLRRHEQLDVHISLCCWQEWQRFVILCRFFFKMNDDSNLSSKWPVKYWLDWLDGDWMIIKYPARLILNLILLAIN